MICKIEGLISMTKRFCILFIFYNKHCNLLMTFYRLKHVALNDIYLVVLTVYLPNNG